MKASTLKIPCRFVNGFLIAAILLLITTTTFAQDTPPAKGKELYDQIKLFSLGGGSATVKALVLNRDRVQMSFDGTFYFATPVDGHVTGAMFLGVGNFTTEVPPNDFEKQNVKRLLGDESVEPDFKTAVLRFRDHTFERLRQSPTLRVE